MEKILSKFESEFKSFGTELKRIEDKQDAKFGAMDTKFTIILWAIGVLSAIILASKFIKY